MIKSEIKILPVGEQQIGVIRKESANLRTDSQKLSNLRTEQKRWRKEYIIVSVNCGSLNDKWSLSCVSVQYMCN